MITTDEVVTSTSFGDKIIYRIVTEVGKGDTKRFEIQEFRDHWSMCCPVGLSYGELSAIQQCIRQLLHGGVVSGESKDDAITINTEHLNAGRTISAIEYDICRREQYALAALPSLISTFEDGGSHTKYVVRVAVEYADALIEALRTKAQ